MTLPDRGSARGDNARHPGMPHQVSIHQAFDDDDRAISLSISVAPRPEERWECRIAKVQILRLVVPDGTGRDRGYPAVLITPRDQEPSEPTPIVEACCSKSTWTSAERS